MSTVQNRITAILKEIEGVRSQSGVQQKDLDFMKRLQGWNTDRLSAKQEQWLSDIERRAFNRKEDSE